jgi:hypothetical protein
VKKIGETSKHDRLAIMSLDFMCNCLFQMNLLVSVANSSSRR